MRRRRTPTTSENPVKQVSTPPWTLNLPFPALNSPAIWPYKPSGPKLCA